MVLSTVAQCHLNTAGEIFIKKVREGSQNMDPRENLSFSELWRAKYRILWGKNPCDFSKKIFLSVEQNITPVLKNHKF